MSLSRIYAMMILCALFWSGAFIAGKLAIREFAPNSLTFFRFLIALPFIFLIAAKWNQGSLLPKARQWPPLITLGLIGTFAYHVLFFSSLQFTSAVNSSLIGSTLPMVTALLAMLFLGEKITLLRAFGIVLAFSGILLVVINGDIELLRAFHLNPGDALMLAAVFSWAVYSILCRRFMTDYALSPLMITAYTFLVCTAAALPFTIWETSLAELARVSGSGWLAVAYMAIFASVLGYLFQLIAVERIGPSRTAIFVNLVPVFTMIQSPLLLHEPVSLLKVTSGAIIIAGVYLTTRSAKAG